jgi:hypothetical protein
MANAENFQQQKRVVKVMTSAVKQHHASMDNAEIHAIVELVPNVKLFVTDPFAVAWKDTRVIQMSDVKRLDVDQIQNAIWTNLV